MLFERFQRVIQLFAPCKTHNCIPSICRGVGDAVGAGLVICLGGFPHARTVQLMKALEYGNCKILYLQQYFLVLDTPNTHAYGEVPCPQRCLGTFFGNVSGVHCEAP